MGEGRFKTGGAGVRLTRGEQRFLGDAQVVRLESPIKAEPAFWRRTTGKENFSGKEPFSLLTDRA